MKKASIFLVFLLGGCAFGINHNTAYIDGKPYLIETQTYTLPLPIYQWSAESTLIELKTPGKGNSTILPKASEETKLILQDIYNRCEIENQRSSYKVKSCIKNAINAL